MNLKRNSILNLLRTYINHIKINSKYENDKNNKMKKIIYLFS